MDNDRKDNDLKNVNKGESDPNDPGMINAGGKQFTGASTDVQTSSKGLPTMENLPKDERDSKNSETAEKS